jgi:phage tail sheath gpL-like
MRTAREYPRHMLASDGTEYPAGLPIVNPTTFKGMLIALYAEFIEKGWVEDIESYSATLLVERDGDDANRLNYVDQPNLANQLQVIAGKTQFIV